MIKCWEYLVFYVFGYDDSILPIQNTIIHRIILQTLKQIVIQRNNYDVQSNK